MNTGYNSKTQTDKNLAWYLPRPKPDHYKGGMPLYAEEWLMDLAATLLEKQRDDLCILNVFCGMNKYGYRVDLNPEVKPDLLCDIHKLGDCEERIKLDLGSTFMFDVVFADPPYSDEETDKLYSDKLPKLNYSKWTKECDKFLKPGGLLIVYHKQVPANPNPEKYSVVKRVFIGNRIWHLPRVAIYFQKRIAQEEEGVLENTFVVGAEADHE
jgi:16S rRNA G966 N2-methylase RsmD